MYVQVAAVRQLVSNELGSPYERLKLIVGGKALEDEKNTKPVTVSFVDGGTVDLTSFCIFVGSFCMCKCQDSGEYMKRGRCLTSRAMILRK